MIEKIKDRINNLIAKDIRWKLAALALLVSIVLFFTLYSVSFERLRGALLDFAVSLGYYFLFVVGIKDVIKPTVNDLPKLNIQTYLPFELDEVVRKFDVFPKVFFDGETFRGYLILLLDKLNDLCIIFSLIVPSVGMLLILVYDKYTEKHVEVKENGKARRAYFWLLAVYNKLCNLVKWFYDYYKENPSIPKKLFFVWLLNTNLMTIVIEALAYYYYMICSFELSSLGAQFIKFFYDYFISLWTLPLPIWAIVYLTVFFIVRRIFAYKKLDHMEAMNRGYINSQPIVVMAVGPMGVGKTKTIVDMTLSLQNDLRDKALALMDKNMMRFSHFDFSAFEAYLRSQIIAGKIINLATARKCIRELRYDYGRHPAPQNLWGYNVRKYPKSYNNGLELVGIWRVLEDYAQEYFVYSLTVSSIVSNIAIRSDLIYIDRGYFESFYTNFFRRSPEKIEEESAYAHIIDFDLFRIGCQMNKDKAIAGSFEFGVILVSEIGKERQNALELKETKKNSDEANQKNDLFNQWLKMIRHAATIEGVCFVRFVCDEQRPESWGADARDLCSVIHILNVSELQLTLAFCFLPSIVEYIHPRYMKWYHKVKKYGNENVLAVFILHTFVSLLFRTAERKRNIFGYYEQTLGAEDGRLKEGQEVHEHPYFLCTKKIYARRYSTDAFKDTFARRALEAGTSLYALPSYKSDCAMLDELKQQKSYMADTFISMYVPATIQYANERKKISK